jgi:hypothetical protein
MDTATALAVPFEFEFEGRWYRISRVTQNIKGRIGNFIRTKLLRDAKEVLPPEEYVAYRREVLLGDPFRSMPDLLQALQTIEATVFMLRCCVEPVDRKDQPPLDDELLMRMVTGSRSLQAITEILGEELKDPKNQRAMLQPTA